MRILLALTLALVAATPATAEVQVLDPAGGAVTLSREDQLVAWADADAVYVSAFGPLSRIDVATRAMTPGPELAPGAVLGPGGRTVLVGDEGFTVRAPDGRVVARVRLDVSVEPAQIAWSPDGRRLAVVRYGTYEDAGELVVVDADTGAVLLRRPRVDGLTPQAFSPDGSALLVSAGRRVLRLVPGGGATTLLRASGQASFDATGQVAITSGRRILIGGTAVRVAAERLGAPLWGADGMLAYVVSGAPEGCAYPFDGLGLLAGGRPRTLIEPAGRELRLALWSPDGRRLAVDLGPRPASDRRGKRRPWPKRVARDYAMFSARGDAAMRRIALRASRALRRGDTRTDVLRRVRLDFHAAAQRFDEAQDTAVVEELGNELDRWLIAAGWRPLDAADEVSC